MPSTLKTVLALLDKSQDINAQAAYMTLKRAIEDGTIIEPDHETLKAGDT